jgi:hypothetical protein
MTTEKKFEDRFEGKSNKWLRARIRKLANSLSSCPARAEAIRGLATKVSLTAQGRAILEAVARDYDPIV